MLFGKVCYPPEVVATTVSSEVPRAIFNRKISARVLASKTTMSFGLRFPTLRKSSKMGSSWHVSESKWNLNPFFKPKLKPKFCFLLNLVPGSFLVAPQLHLPDEPLHPPPLDLQPAVLLLQLDHSGKQVLEQLLRGLQRRARVGPREARWSAIFTCVSF